jgi:hypothetical protein
MGWRTPRDAQFRTDSHTRDWRRVEASRDAVSGTGDSALGAIGLLSTSGMQIDDGGLVNFDTSITWQQLEERLARTTNPRHRVMLQTVIDHAKAEARGDVDGLMATLSDDPQYHYWNAGRDWGPKGQARVRAYYEGFVASGAGFFESYKPRIVVDDDNVVTENVMRGIVPGAVARARGCDIDDVEGHYLVTARVTIFWPFNEAAELVGEDSYGSSDATDCQRVPDDELPAEYVAMLDAIGFGGVAAFR